MSEGNSETHAASSAAPNVVPAAVALPSDGPPRQARHLGKQLIGIALAIGLLAVAFRGINMEQLWQTVQKVNLAWIAALMVSCVLSCYIRAVRWVLMLQPLSDHKVSVWNSFCAINYSYAVNLIIPRGGEVVRVISISKSENIPWAGVVPTLLIDRLLDLAMLVGMVGVTMVIIPPGIKSQFPFLVPTGIVMCVATAIGLALLPKAGAIVKAVVGLSFVKEKLPARIFDTVVQLAGQVEQGTQSLKSPGTLALIVVLSFGIWTFYYLNLETVVLAFDLQSYLDLAKTFIIWTICSASVVAPVPGAMGAFHMACSQSLQLIGGIDQTHALAFAAVLHTVSFVIAACLTAAFCFIVESSKSKRSDVVGSGSGV